jgi:hypothetical protein
VGKERRAFTRLLEKYALHKPCSICPAGSVTGYTALLIAAGLTGGALCWQDTSCVTRRAFRKFVCSYDRVCRHSILN